MPKRPSPFIVIEALDAGGSQTQTDWLVRRLQQEKYQPLSLHFPQEDRATGRLIYDKFLLHKNKKPFSRREQALLYIQDFFSRAEDITAHTSEKSGRQLVVSDRFCTSAFAYQTMGLRGQEWQEMYDWIWWLCFTGQPTLPQPDLVLFLDTPVAVSLRRLKEKNKDFFETKEKLTAIRAAYLKVAAVQGWITIAGVDGQGQERTREDLHEEVWQYVKPRLIAS
ncbi:MAG: hypothetical protein WEA04_04335 [Candidatus Andersenbacteria bacterium]